jgi:hypothetical protein
MGMRNSGAVMSGNFEPESLNIHNDASHRSADTPGSVSGSKSTALQAPSSIVEANIEKLRTIVTQPKTFFSTFPLDEPISEPATFYGCIVGVNLIGTLVFSLFHMEALLANLGTVVLGSVMTFAVGCGLMRFAASKFGGTGTFAGIARACAYASAPSVLGWIPIINLFAFIYSLYLSKLAVERVEGIEGTRSTIVIGIAVGVPFFIGVLVTIMSAILLVKKAVGS